MAGCQAGADAAAAKYGARVEMLGPSVPTDIAGQVSIVNDQITRGVDAILLTAGDARRLCLRSSVLCVKAFP